MSFLLALFPFYMVLIDGNIRTSISDYAYSEYNFFYIFFITMIGSIFFYDGYLYKKRYYNIILGVSLWGISLTPYKQYEILHFIFSFIFFIGSVFFILLKIKSKYIYIRIFLSVILLLSILLYKPFNLITLFWAECIGILPILLNYILELISLKELN